jgi:hypothetical protein
MTNLKRRSLLIIVLSFVVVFILLIMVIAPRFHASRQENSQAESEDSRSYFELLKKARDSIRQSPDHLPGRLSSIIKNGTPEQLIHFIRNNFQVLPTTDKGWQSAEYATRWGIAGTLRAGAGTPRELAELLNMALTQMGYASKVVTLKETPRNLRSFFDDIQRSSFNVTLDTPGYAQQLQGRPLSSRAEFSLSDAITKPVKQAIQSDKMKIESFDNKLPELPTVLYTVAGKNGQAETIRVANLWEGDDRPFTDAPYRMTVGAHEVPKITLSVLVALADYPDRPVEILRHQWKTDELIGRHLDISFIPITGDLQQALTMPPKLHNTFIPSIKINPSTGFDSKFESNKAQYVFGDPITRQGERIKQTETGFQIGDGRVAMTGDSGKVANINIKRLVTGHYPWLKLSAEFKDENGASVYAVPASHIAATIAGQSVPLVVRNNLPVAPRIILLIDTSTSVAPEYRGNNIEILVKELAGRILAKWPDAQFKIGIAGGSGASFMHWTHDLDDLAANTHHMALESPLWRSYARAVEQKPDAIVFVTDGQAISHQFGIVNTLPEELKPIYNIAPPTVVLGAGTEKYPLGPAFKGIAEASNGIALDIKDVKKSAELVNEFLRERIVPYELWVNAGALKEVQASSETLLTLSAGNAVGEKSFVIPNLNERAFGQSISGLYLKIDSHYGTTTRRLAGAMLGTKSPSESDKMNAQMGLFGRYSLMIEAGSPSLAQQLDDVISSRLSWQPVIEAKDLKQSKMALQQAYTLPSSRFSFSVPLQHLARTELPVIDLGPRFWLESEQQVKNGEGNELHQKRIDIVPLTRFFSLQKSPDKRLADTLRASLVLSDIESAITQQSGLKYLNTEHSALDLMWA